MKKHFSIRLEFLHDCFIEATCENDDTVGSEFVTIRSKFDKERILKISTSNLIKITQAIIKLSDKYREAVN